MQKLFGDDMSRDKRISNEIDRLRQLISKLDDNKKQVAEGLIKRIAFMQVTLEDLEEDINRNGTYESFSQTANVEYDRERPATRIYNTTIKNYTTACKSLFDLVPNGESKEEIKDELMGFLAKR